MRQFVGRDEVCSGFVQALRAIEPQCVLQFVHGPGGVGKSWLLRRYADLAAENGALALSLDARSIEASTGAIISALENALHASPIGRQAGDADVITQLAGLQQRCVILIDTYEMLAPLDGWLREHWLPQLPDNVMLVLAGRNPPSAEWRVHPEWNGLLRNLPLRNLEPHDGRDYLLRRMVPADHHEVALNFTRGHPLALSLVADIYAQRKSLNALSADDAPDVIKALLDNFVQKVPGPAHRAALEACALVRVLNEGMLARMLQTKDAHELFEWLRGLSFVDSGRHGLYPHDLARDVIAAELRWRNPDWFAALHKRARAHYTARINEQTGHEQQRAIYDFMFLHRHNGIVRQFMDWQENGSVRAEPLQPDQVMHVVSAVRVAEGGDAAAIATHWLARRLSSGVALMDGSRLAGYMIRLPLHDTDAHDLANDPIAARAWRLLQSSAAARTGEQVLMFRFWGAPADAAQYQAVSAVQSLIFVLAVQAYLATPKLAATFFCCAQPDFWAGLFAYADLERLSELDHTQLGQPHGVYFHDWRQTPPIAWLDLLAEREMSLTPPTAPSFRSQTQLIALSESVFADGLKDAFKHMARPGGLRGNPLLGCRMVQEAAGSTGATDAARSDALKQLIVTHAALLEGNARDVKLYRAFYHTYIKPAVSQEAASELIDVPFSSYRRHLQSAAERITSTLWQQELGD